MQRTFAFKLARRVHLKSMLALAVVVVASSGYTSCAGTAGPLIRPRLTVVPGEVLLRASLAARQDATGLARVDGGDDGDQFTASVEYGKNAATNWLAANLDDRIVMLSATPGGLDPGVYLATVTVHREGSEETATFTVEFTVTP